MNTELLLIILFTCHWIADYTWLSTSWMLNAKRFGTPWYPIFAHALVHGLLMAAVLYFVVGFNWTLLQLTCFQIITHFTIDVWKGRMNGWFPALQSPANKLHWVIFGFDQLLHTIVIIIMAYFATKK